MNIVSLLIDGLWAGLLSGAFVVIFSAPPQILPFGAAGGFIARICRDLLMQTGGGQTLATFAAAAIVVVAMGILVRASRPGLAPVVLVSSLLPLGAAKPFFAAIIALMRAPSLKPDDIAAAPAALMSDVSVVFSLTLAIALGVAVGAIILEVARTKVL